MASSNSPQPLQPRPVTWALDALPLKIGSSARAHLTLDDAQIAPLHACIERSPHQGQLILRVFNSRHNTTHQGQLVERAAILHDQDVIGFGTHLFALDLSDPQTLALTPYQAPQQTTPPEAEPALEATHLDALEAEFFTQPGALVQQQLMEHDEPRSLELLLLWQEQIIAAHTYQRAQTLTVGSSPSCDYLIDTQDPRLERFELITHDPLKGWRLHLPPGVEGSLCWDDDWRAVEHLDAQTIHTLFMNERPDSLREAHLSLGSVRLIIRHNARAERYPRTIQPDRQQLHDIGYITLSAVLHWSALLLILSIPARQRLEPIPDEHEQVVILEVTQAPPPLPPPAPSALKEDTIGDGQQADADAKHAFEEGAAGDPRQRPDQQGQLQLARHTPSKDAKPTLTLKQEAEHAPSTDPAHAGVLSVLGGAQQSAGHRALTAALSAQEATASLGQLQLEAKAPGHGRFGLGLSGAGRGGAGEHERSLGIARLPSKRAMASLGGQGLSLEDERGQLSSQLIVTQDAAQGGQDCLSSQIIARVIRARSAQLRSCYEQALTHHSELRGRLLVQLVIQPTGQVLRAQLIEDTLKSRSVAQCITKTMKTMHFPAYQGCQVVQANYPLRFAPSPP